VIEKDLPSAFPENGGATLREVAFVPVRRRVTQGDQPFLASFAHDPDKWWIQVQSIEGQPDQFRHSQTSGVEGLDHRPVSQSQRCVDVRSLQEGFNLGLRQDVRDGSPELRGLKIRGRVELGPFVPDQKAVETPNGREATGC